MSVLSTRALFLASITGLILTGCNTLPENPDYKSSTDNQVQSPSPITYASSPSATGAYGNSQSAQTRDIAYENCRAKESNRELAGAAIGGTVGAIAGDKIIGGTKGTVIGAAIGGTAGYGVGDKIAPAAQQYGSSSAVPQPQPYIAPKSYSAPDTHGTAGQSAPTDAAYAGTSMAGTPGYEALNAVPVEYDYSENIVSTAASAPAHRGQTQIQTLSGATQQHIVRQGDTVYSLSKNLCAGIDEVQNLNNLGDDFAIRIGDNLTLPTSRC